MKQTTSSKHPLSWLLSLVQTVLIILLIGVALVSFSSRIPVLAKYGITFYNITSGSMEPKIPTGSVVYAGRFKIEDLKKDDIITFLVKPSEDEKPVVVTHRIFEVLKKEQNSQLPEQKDKKIVEYQFKTKGDANTSEDGNLTDAGNILGKYRWHIPYLGYISNFVQKPLGFALFVLLPAVVLVIWEVVSLVLHFKKHYEDKSRLEIEKLKKSLAQPAQGDQE